MQAIVAAEVGYQEMAMEYFRTGLFVDLADLHNNTRDGVHIASTGGVWNALVYGFGGMRDYQGTLTFDPRLPKDWSSLNFPLRQHESRIRVHLEKTHISFDLEEGEPVELFVRGEPVLVGNDGPVRVELDGQGESLPSLEGLHPVTGNRRADGSVITALVPEPHHQDVSGLTA